MAINQISPSTSFALAYAGARVFSHLCLVASFFRGKQEQKQEMAGR